jgi:hypothetical protein
MRIVSISLGYHGYAPVFARLIEVLVSRNVLPVFAIGKCGCEFLARPTCFMPVGSSWRMQRKREGTPLHRSHSSIA